VLTLLVGGRHDECTPGYLEDMHRRIAGSQLTIIEDAPPSVLRRAARPTSPQLSILLTEI
jgi:hypothetical protein